MVYGVLLIRHLLKRVSFCLLMIGCFAESRFLKYCQSLLVLSFGVSPWIAHGAWPFLPLNWYTALKAMTALSSRDALST